MRLILEVWRYHQFLVEPGDRLNIKILSYQYRGSRDRFIFNMGIPIPGKVGLYIETGPRWLFSANTRPQRNTSKKRPDNAPGVL